MKYLWLKRLCLLITSILFYIAGLYCVDLLVQNKIFTPNLEKGKMDFFFIANFLVIFFFTCLIIILTKRKVSESVLDDFKYPFIATVFFCILGSMDFLPSWVNKIYICVPLLSVGWMTFISYKYSYPPFANAIWKIRGIESYWVFNSNHTMQLCATDSTVTNFKWMYNPYTSTLYLESQNEKRVYVVKQESDIRMKLIQLTHISDLILSFELMSPELIKPNYSKPKETKVE